MTEKVYEKVGNIQKREEEWIDGGSDWGDALVPFAHTQEITVAASGTTGDSDDLMVPAACLVFGVVAIVTQAPGGGATTMDIGRKDGGNTDEFIDGASCDELGDSCNTAADRASDTTAMPLLVAAGDEIRVTVNSAVTGADLKVRVTVLGFRFNEATIPS